MVFTRIYTFTFTTCSYHQKYLLQMHRDIMNALRFSSEDLLTSHVACRLNGYCGGYGTLEQLEAELPVFMLGPEIEAKMREIVGSRSRYR